MKPPLPPLDLDHLARRCLAGDPGAWQQFQRALGRPLLAAVRRQLRRHPHRDRYPVECEDVLQELWLRLHDAPRRGAGVLRRLLDAAKPLQPALERFARELARNAVRSAEQRREREATAARPLLATDPDGPLAAARAELLTRLSAGDQEVLRAEIGEGPALAASPEAVRQRCHRLRRRVEFLLRGP